MWTRSKIIFVTGKGGVGKSIVSAALAQSFPKGARVLLVETDTYSVFDGENTSPGTIRIRQHEKISTTNLTPQACVVATFSKFLPSKRIVRAVVENRITRAFIDSAPSVNEFVILDQIFEFAASKEWDHIVVDLPASGHAITFLSVPKTLAEMMRSMGPIGKRAAKIRDAMMNSEEVSIVAICLPEEMPVNETIELNLSLKEKLGRALDDIIVNMINQMPVEEKDLETLRSTKKSKYKDKKIWKMIEANQIAADWSFRDAFYLEELKRRIDVEQHYIPVFYEESDIALSQRIAEILEKKTLFSVKEN